MTASRTPAARSRSAAVGDDAPARHARPELAARRSRRVVLRARSSRPGTAARSTSPRSSTTSGGSARSRVGGRPGARRAAPAPRHGARRRDRGRLRDLRRRPGQGALGRQDADVHAVPARCSSGCSRTAQYVHLVRDGRDAARLVPRHAGRNRHAHLGAPALGRGLRLPVADGGRGCAAASARASAPTGTCEVRYEALVADPEARAEADLRLRRSAVRSRHAPPRRGPRRLGEAAPAELKRPLTPGVRDWRNELGPEDAAAFEDVAGGLLAALGYELSTAAPTAPSARAQARLASYRARSWAWRATAAPCSARRSGAAGTRSSSSRSRGGLFSPR